MTQLLRESVAQVGAPTFSPNPAITLFALLFGALWTVTNLYAFYPIVQTALDHVVTRRSAWSPTDRPEPSTYPSVDVFVAAYDEAAVIEQAIGSIDAARYPGELTLTVLLEPDDDATREAVEALRDRYDFQLLTVPEGYPGEQNKPRALNYGFERTSGAIVGVVDAEDIVDPQLFVSAATAIADGADYAQARLDMANEDDGWLNLMFRAEYGFWYNVITPAFVHVGYPLPLAGTSCFFKRSVLTEMSAARLDRMDDSWSERAWEWVRARGLSGVRPWDPNNVTEDFEIGLSLWEHGYELSYLDESTVEESPLGLDSWLDQRTRWKKGKIYTFLERLQNPPESLSARGHIYWQSLLPHLGPVNIAAIVIITLIGNLARYRPGTLVGAVLALGLTFGLLYCLFFGLGYAVTSDTPPPTRLRRAILVSVTVPFYWFFQWGADLRALSKTYAGQFEWEHTTHVGRHADGQQRDPTTVSRASGGATIARRQRWLALAALVVTGAALRLFALDSRSLWLGELDAVAGRADTVATALEATVASPQPPLYYLVVHGWTAAFGTDPVVVRLLSVVFGLATIVAVYLLATELFDDVAGLVAALLVTVSAFFIHYARTAESYALLLLLTAYSWYWFTRLRDGNRYNTTGYLLTTALLCYTHLFGILVVAAQQVYVYLSELNAGISSARWLRIQGALGVLVLPWLVELARVVAAAVGGSERLAPPLPRGALTDTGLAFVGFPDFYPFTTDSIALYVLASAVLFVYVAQLLTSLFSLESGLPTLTDGDAVGQLTALVAVVVVVPYLVSTVFPLFRPESVAPASVAVSVLAARGIQNVPLGRLRAAFLSVLVLSSLLFVGVYYTTDSAEPMNNVAVTVQAAADADDAVVYSSPSLESFAAYYYSDPAFTQLVVSTPQSSQLPALSTLVSNHDAVYLVQYQQEGAIVVDFLTACHDGREVSEFGMITVYTFERATGCPAPDSPRSNWGE